MRGSGGRVMWIAVVAVMLAAAGAFAASAQEPPPGVTGPPPGVTGPPPGGGGGGGGGPSAEMLAGLACAPLQAQMGAQFTTKFGSLAGCIAKVTPIAAAALAKCQTDQACIQKELQAGIQALVGGGSGGAPSAAQLGDTIATQACNAAKQQLKKKFPYASIAACKKKIKAKATALAKAAIKKCGTSQTSQACLQRELQKGAATLQAALGKK